MPIDTWIDYFEKVDNEFVITKYVSDGTLINGEDYYCIEKNKFTFHY